MHVQVGDFDLLDPLLDARGAGSPRPARRSSCTPAGDRSATTTPVPRPMRALMERHPTLTAVVAHMGARSTPASSPSPRTSSGCTWTPRWRSPTSSRRWRRSRATCCRGCGTSATGAARLGLPEHPLPLRPPARGPRAARTSGTTGCGGSAGTTPRSCSSGIPDGRSDALGPVDCQAAQIHNSRGADRFRLGTLVPGEAGRGSQGHLVNAPWKPITANSQRSSFALAA